MTYRSSIIFFLLLQLLLYSGCTKKFANFSKKEIVLLLEPREGNPRNSEGDFISLKDGRLLFVYSHFTEGSGDNAGAFLAGRYSDDEGRTWTTTDEIILENEGDMNIMSVSLFRLSDDRIALFYLRKNSESDCIPYIRISSDEAKSWGEARRCIPDDGYFVVNNDRVVRLESGRIIFPTSLHKTPESERSGIGMIRCYYSDNEGETWVRGQDAPNPNKATTQEPGIIELKDGKLMLFCRTESGTQFISYSSDQGISWSSLQPSNIKSPLSPASIERIPQTGDLLLVWNNNYKPIHDGGKRTPFNLAISKDEGKSWEKIKTLESNPNGWYCYTAIEFVGDHVLLGHCAGDRAKSIGLATTQITRLNYDWIYGYATLNPTINEDSNGIIKLNCSDKDAEIYYSLERNTPNKLYDSPINVSRTTPLWVYAKSKGKSKSELITAYVGTDILQPALDLSNSTIQGLTYDYYEAALTTVENIDKLPPVAKGVTRDFNINNRRNDTSFAFIFRGYITVPADGKYTFYLSSNDGSVLYLDDHELINNDGAHSMIEQFASVSLYKGNHKIVLKYFQMLGGLGLTLDWKGPNFDRFEIPNSVLSY